MTSNLRKGISAGIMAATLTFGAGSIQTDPAMAFQHVQRTSVAQVHDRGGGSAPHVDARPSRASAFTPRSSQPRPASEPRGHDNYHGNYSPRRDNAPHYVTTGDRGRYEHRSGEGRHGWGRRFWNSAWPFIVFVGEYQASGVNQEALNLGPDFNDAYFLVSGYRSFDQCSMRVELYDRNDNFIASIFPGDMYSPQRSQFGDQILAAGLNRPDVQQQIADDLCDGGYPEFR